MKTKLYSLAIVFVSVFILSNDSCKKEYIGPEDEINQGWQEYADNLNEHSTLCSNKISTIEKTWVEEMAKEAIFAFIEENEYPTYPQYPIEFEAYVNVFSNSEGKVIYAIEANEEGVLQELDGDQFNYWVFDCESNVIANNVDVDDQEIMFEYDYLLNSFVISYTHFWEE